MLVNLILDLKARREVADDRVRGILDIDADALCPWMAIERSTDEILVFWPGVQRVRSGVHPAKPFARSDELKKRRFLIASQGQLSGREKEHPVECAKIVSCDRGKILSWCDLQLLGSQGSENLNGRADRLVSETSRVGDVEDAFRLS